MAIATVAREAVDSAAEILAQRQILFRARWPDATRAFEDHERCVAALEPLLDSGLAVGAWRDRRLVGYVAATVDGHLALVPAGGHAVDPSEDDPGATYARMYAELAELLVERGARVHDVAIPAMTSIEDAWYDLGFGRRVCIASRSTLPPRARQPTSSDVRVREAGEDDMDAIARLSSMEVAYRARSPMFMAAVPPDLESVRASHLELAERGALHFLATLDGEPAGLLTLLRESRFQPISSEGGVFVGPTATDPRFWRRGVASALVWSALEWARRHDHRRIDVSYLSANLLSRRFWRHAGFATIGWRVERRLPESTVAAG